jgi:hypothetical protein
MTHQEIENELENFEGEVYFVNLMSQFVWSETQKKVVGYHELSTPLNKLIVMGTKPVDLGKKTLSKYLEQEGVTEEDVLVFCINEEYYPKQKGNWILIAILKKIHRKKYDSRRTTQNEDKNPDDNKGFKNKFM